jgi:hypothetical protein
MTPIQIKLTKFLLSLNRYKFKQLREYVLPNNLRVEIITFEGKSSQIGITTPFKTIIINEDLFHKYTKAVQDYVIAHELGHRRFSYPIFNFISLLLLFGFILEILGLLVIIFSVMLIIIFKFLVFFCLGLWG